MKSLLSNSTLARRSNFELLRVLCMLAIIAQHLFTQGDVLRHIANPVPGAGFTAALFVSSAGRIAVNVFLILGCWFLVDSPRFRADRWLRLWLQVFCWTAPLTLWMLDEGRIGTGDAIKGFLPFFGRPLWFASAWLTLLLLAPFLNSAFSLGRCRLAALLAILAAVLCLPATVGDARAGYFADLPWFVFVYLATGFLKKHTAFVSLNQWAFLLVALAVYAALVAVRWDAAQPNPQLPVRANVLCERWLADIKSLPNALCALCLFGFFARLEIGSIKILNWVAKPSFGVYVGHQVPAFISYLWYGFCGVDTWFREPDAAWIGIAMVPAVYAAFAVLDVLRGAIIEPLFVKRRWFTALSAKMERLVCGTTLQGAST